MVRDWLKEQLETVVDERYKELKKEWKGGKKKMKEGDRLYINRSKSGKGVYISNTDLNWMLIGNIEHLRNFVDGKKEYVVVEVRKKEQKNGTKD